jgi:beta-N-acetylhexosaminidase
VAELIEAVQSNRPKDSLPLWVSVDQEGGRVQRFKKPFSILPSAEIVGATGSPKLAYELAEIMARELKAVGVNINFAPVADINTNPKNPVIGPRAFGSKEEEVSKMVTAIVRGHLTQGVLPCVKHFPGHGDTHLDTHYALPKIDTDLETLRSREMLPFAKAFKSKCSMVMTAHILNPHLDPAVPGTLSQKTVQGLLRDELKFKGIIFSDDMEMKAIADHYGIEDAPVMAIQAGCDQVIYRSESAGMAAYESLMRALESGRLDPKRVMESSDRLRQLKKEVLLPHKPPVISEIPSQIGTAENTAKIAEIEELGRSKLA